MKKMLACWEGKYLVNGKILENLNEWKPKDGENFSIKLLAKRKRRSK